MTQENGLDPEALARLRQWGGDALLGKMAELFLANTPDRIDQIRKGVAGDDAALVERGAHSLKSTAANLGAMRLRDLAAALEDRATEGEAGALESELPALETEYQWARGEIEKLGKG